MMSNLTGNSIALTGPGQAFASRSHELVIREEVYRDKAQRHAHVYFEMLYVRKGYAFFCCRQMAELIFPGDLIVVWPGVAHSLLQCCELAVAECAFSQDFFQAYGKGLLQLDALRALSVPGSAARVHETTQPESGFERILNGMLAEQEQKWVGWRENMRMLFGQLLVEYARCCAGEEGPQHSQPANLAVVRKVLSIIDERCMENLEAREIAGMVGMNVDYLARSFKKVTGMTPKECLRSYRMKKAYELLRSGQHSVSSVAAQLGFDNAGNFSRQFKHVMGISPRDVR